MPKNVSKKLQGTNIRTDRCFNPFKKKSHSNIRELKLRKVNENQLRALNLPVTPESLEQRICTPCRLRIKNNKENDDDITNAEAEMVSVYEFTNKQCKSTCMHSITT